MLVAVAQVTTSNVNSLETQLGDILGQSLLANIRVIGQFFTTFNNTMKRAYWFRVRFVKLLMWQARFLKTVSVINTRYRRTRRLISDKMRRFATICSGLWN